MSDINALSQKERALLNKMLPSSKFGFEELDAFYESNHIYNEWSAIFQEYVNLALAGNVEALKRALFFIWYNIAEPYELSGLKYIDKELASKILSLINTLIVENKIDTELSWMLGFYYMDDFYLSGYAGINDLIQYSIQNQALSESERHKSSFENRGQLGDYFKR